MRSTAVLVFSLLACAPHDREDGPLFAAPAVDPSPDATRSAVVAPERPIAAAPDRDEGCDPAIADKPTVLFGNSVLIRMPRGVEMHEDNPRFASAVASGGFEVTCGAVLRRASLMLLASDERKSINDYAREATELLEKGGYYGAREMVWSSPEPDRRRGMVVIPAEQGLPETEILADVRRASDVVTVLFYEAESEHFGRLAPSLLMSADSLLVGPPG